MRSTVESSVSVCLTLDCDGVVVRDGALAVRGSADVLAVIGLRHALNLQPAAVVQRPDTAGRERTVDPIPLHVWSWS